MSLSGVCRNHHQRDCGCFNIKEFKNSRCQEHHLSNNCHDRHKCSRCHNSGCLSSHFDCRDYLFEITLAGLMDNLNFKLLKNRNCPLKVATEGGCQFTGKTCNVGIDYIDIKDRHGKVVTILKDKLSHIEWECKKCKPHCWECEN